MYSKGNEKPMFIENKGQVAYQNGHPANDVKYVYSTPGIKLIMKKNSFSYELYSYSNEDKNPISEASGKHGNEQGNRLENNEDVTVHASLIEITLKGSNPEPEIIAEDRSSSYTNYYMPNTPETGILHIFGYNRITYRNIYNNIDFVFYAQLGGGIKYDIVVRPGGKLEDIKMIYKGMKNLKMEAGKIQFKIYGGSLTEEIPCSYLQASNISQKIKYDLRGTEIGFKGDYDHNNTLVVDPLLLWSTYFGSGGFDDCYAMVTDSFGNAYYAGYTEGATDYIFVTKGAYESTFDKKKYTSSYIVKFNKICGRAWGTYYGIQDNISAITLDHAGHLFLAGSTNADSGITTSGAFQTQRGSYPNKTSDAFLVKFDTSGKRIWATYYGGIDNDNGNSVVADRSGNVYMSGITLNTNGLATSGALQTSFNNTNLAQKSTYLVKFNAGGARQWATYFSEFYVGYGFNPSCALAIDANDNVLLTGITNMDTGVATPGAYQLKHGGSDPTFNDAFLVKFNGQGKRLWGTYFGGNGDDIGNAIALDNSGNIFLAGNTSSDSGIATAGAFLTSRSAVWDDCAFLVKFNNNGQRLWSTYYGGDNTVGNAVSVDGDGNVYLAGSTWSTTDIATSGAYQTGYGGGGYTGTNPTGDAFFAKFNASGSRQWGTYFGGSDNDAGYATATDRYGCVYMAGTTASSSGIAPYSNPLLPYEYYWGGFDDGFFTKFDDPWLPNAGIIDIDSSAINICSGVQKIYARIKNYSVNFNLDTAYIGWSINGTAQKSYKWTGILKTRDTSSEILLGSYNFQNAPVSIKVWTYRPNDTIDQDNTNDTIAKNYVIHPSPDAAFADVKLKAFDYSFVPKDTTQAKYFWQFGDGSSSKIIKPTHLYVKNDSFTVQLTVTGSNGCSSISSSTVSTLSGIGDKIFTLFGIKIYPNPFTSSIIIEKQNGQEVNFEICDMTGKLVHSVLLNQNRTQIDLTGLPVGQYIVKINSDSHAFIDKIIKE